MEMDTLAAYRMIALTHKQLPLHDLGRYVLDTDNDRLRERLESLKKDLELRELLYLATCNRVLFFFVPEQPLTLERFVATTYAHLPDDARAQATRHAQDFDGESAVEHLFEVASSLDSLVVGEREILRQLRAAYDQCTQWGLTDDHIRLAMRFTVEIAKKVYSQTAIGEKPVSVVSLAMQQLFAQPLPAHPRVLLVGAGQTNQLVAKFLAKHQIDNVSVFNRTLPKAEALAAQLGGRAYRLHDLESYTEGFDVLIACTAATEAIITPELYAQLLQGDTRKKVLLDLSLPSNIDPSIAEAHPAAYIEIESLKALAKENLSFRENEVAHAKTLIDEALQEFHGLFRARQIEKALQPIPTQIKAIKQHAMENVFRQEVASLDDNAKQVLQKVLDYMEKRCIAIPIQVAKEVLL